MKFNEKLCILRRKKGWSQEDLANEVEVSRQSVYKWESGKNVPDIEKIKELAKIFNISLDELLIDERELVYAPTNAVAENTSSPSEVEKTTYANSDKNDTATQKTISCNSEVITKTEIEKLESVDIDNSDVEDDHQLSADSILHESTNGKHIAKSKLIFIIEIVKLVINCIALSLLFIPLFHEVAALPGISENGEHFVTRCDYYYSVYEKIAGECLSEWLWVAVVTIAVSILFCVLNMIIKNNKTLKITGYVIWSISMVLFLALLFIACSISYTY